MSVYRERFPEVLVAAQQWFSATDTAEDPVTLETEADGTRYGLLHRHEGSALRVNDGDYIINLPRGEDGVQRWNALNPRDFLAKYEPTEKSAKYAPIENADPTKKLKGGE
jgi:hypothetical protein